MSLFSLCFFLWILCEAFRFQRCLIFPLVNKTESEWCHRGFPVAYHGQSQRGVSFASRGPVGRLRKMIGKIKGKFKRL